MLVLGRSYNTMEGDIVAYLKGDHIVVTDNKGKSYRVPADEPGRTEMGHTSFLTWREAIESDRLIVHNADISGHAPFQHGALFVIEPRRKK